MIRSREEAREKFAKALELTSVLVLFGLPLVLSQALVPAASIWRLLVPVISFVVAIALPVLVYGGPKFVLKWSIQNEKHEGVAIVNLSSVPRNEGLPEVMFCVDLHVTTDSIWGWARRSSLINRSAMVKIEILPPQSATVKLQSRTGNASLEHAETQPGPIVRQFICLPVTSASETAAQSRFVGSMVFAAVVSKTEDLTPSATLHFVTKRGKAKSKELADHPSAIRTIKIRS